jgi:hypothetical protein
MRDHAVKEGVLVKMKSASPERTGIDPIPIAFCLLGHDDDRFASSGCKTIERTERISRRIAMLPSQIAERFKR